MDSGLVTSERGPHRRDTVVGAAMPTKHSEPMMGPSVTCRQCRIQILLDDMESHECDPKDLKMATQSPRAQAALLSAATRASSFLDSFLDTPAAESPTTSQKTSESPLTTKPKEQLLAVRAVEAARSPAASGLQAAHPVTVDEKSLSGVKYESLSHTHSTQSHSQSPTHSESTSVGVASPTLQPQSLVGRSHSAVDPTTSSLVAEETRTRGFSSSDMTSLLAPVKSRVRGVRLNKDKVAVYSIVSNVLGHAAAEPHAIANVFANTLATPETPREIIVERRYREFYSFALAVYSMFPSQELWGRLPPKTLCLPTARNQSGGFLLRRKNGLDDFVRRALELIDLGGSQGSISQWYLVRKFLNLPAKNVTGVNQPTKDRSLVAAMHELKKHALQSAGWTAVGRVDDHDAMYEKVSDSFHMVKRVKMCPFPARAIFDMITNRSVVKPSATASGGGVGVSDSGDAATVNVGLASASWDPLVESVEVLGRENRQTWTERVVYKPGRWTRRNMEMISLKTWKVDEAGSIVIAIIPADDSEWTHVDPRANPNGRVDCILGGWIITPIPGEETCSVAWLMQANFGECDPRSEFTGPQGYSTSFVARSMLLSWAEEITHLLQSLERTYDPTHYRNLGPLLSGGDFNKLKLERRDTMSGKVDEDPRVYVLAQELEPSMCLLIHKSTNTNALIFRLNYRRMLDKQQQQQLREPDPNVPLKAEWIMFEKTGNPRHDLSAIERSTMYPFSTRLVGPNVFQFTLELIRRDCVLRNDPSHGFALFTTINGKPNALLKRVYLSYSKPASRLSFVPKLEEIHLYGLSDREIITMVAPTASK